MNDLLLIVAAIIVGVLAVIWLAEALERRYERLQNEAEDRRRQAEAIIAIMRHERREAIRRRNTTPKASVLTAQNAVRKEAKS